MLKIAFAALGFSTVALTTHLPVVDLGYALHRARFNESGDYYSFKNIRFADAPVGKNRFQPPVAVSSVNRTVSDGPEVGNICPQGYPDWTLVDGAKEAGVSVEEYRRRLESDPRNSEDCLFLDVVVPRTLFGGGRGKCGKAGAPVMVWIYGGGYVFGLKDDEVYNPSGLVAGSFEDGGKGIIYVALNYRLGMYGWLNGLGDEDIFPNVALQDQLFGLEWVKKYIHLFGGDANRITVFGESAGGGSIMHHLTAKDGHTSLPFQRAIIQSPGYQPVLDLPGIWNRTLETASNITGRSISNGAALAAIDAPTLYKINNKIIQDSPISTYTYGPSIDGTYVRDTPTVRLQQGKFNTEPQLMLGHNLHEGLAYITPDINTSALVATKLDQVLPIAQSTKTYILSTLYPPAPWGPYKTENERAVLLFTELFFACNTRGLGTAYRNETWNYRFEVPPATHGQDVAYTFYNGERKGGDLAVDMQRYFTKFGEFGNPNVKGSLREWERYGDGARLVTFGEEGVGGDEDELRNRRCEYWLGGRYRSV